MRGYGDALEVSRANSTSILSAKLDGSMIIEKWSRSIQTVLIMDVGSCNCV